MILVFLLNSKWQKNQSDIFFLIFSVRFAQIKPICLPHYRKIVILRYKFHFGRYQFLATVHKNHLSYSYNGHEGHFRQHHFFEGASHLAWVSTRYYRFPAKNKWCCETLWTKSTELCSQINCENVLWNLSESDFLTWK